MSHRPRIVLLLLLVAFIAASVAEPFAASGATSSANPASAASALTPPDDPGPLSSDPNSMTDIGRADPIAGVNLIEPPQPDPSGEARLAYPIEVPPGRAGMQPSISVDYSSGDANGWMGLGWNVSLSYITIDTRWGVPRYDPADETETYMLDDGTQLTPLAHRGAPQPRSAEKVFHTRVEQDFQKIIRHGSGPASYWWEVVDKDGTRSFYGGSPETNGPAADATLVDGHGNIYAWGLREMRDTHGNSVAYRYDRVSDPGIAGSSVPGSELYLKSINYTGSSGAAGAYTVTFYRDREMPGLPNFVGAPAYRRRADVIVDGRGGFKLVTADLLRRIDVTFNGDLVRRYDFMYREGAFKKTLLQSITQSGADGAAFNTHTFSYYDEIRDSGGAYHGFDSSTSWNTTNDGVGAPRVPLSGQASALGGAVTDEGGGHLYVGFNLDDPLKEGSAGGKIGFNYSSTDTVLAMLDLNGDQLPDKVFKASGGQVYFRLNRSGPSGTTVFGPPVAIPSLSALGQETATTISGGPELYLVANLIYNHAETFTTSSVYFSDANGDGLPDLVTGSQVSFNHLEGGVPTFTPNSSDTPVPIGPGAVDSTGIISNYDALYQQAIDQAPLLDTLRRWVAPYDGQIQISGTVALIQDTSPARAQYQTADGVRVAIQHNGGELWSAQIGPNDYAPKTPSGVGAISVHAGDRIYFRVQSVFDGRYDQVAWDPRISYRNVTPALDVNGLDSYAYQASADFALAGRRDMTVETPLTGTLRLDGALHKLGQTTDDVTLLVLKNGAPIFSQTRAWNQTGDFGLPADFAVLKGDKIQLRVKVDSPIDLRQLQWNPSLFYVATNPPQPITDANGSYLFQLHPPYDIDLYPASNLSAPQQSWLVPQSGTLTIVPHLTAGAGANGTVAFTVKRQGALLARRTITVSNGVVQGAQFDLAVTQGDRLYFDFSVYDPALAARLSSPSVAVVFGDPNNDPTTTVPSALHSAVVPGLFAEPYRGWAYVGYNGNRARAAQPIDEALLTITNSVPPRNPDGSVNYNGYNPTTSATAYLFTPIPDQNIWRGPVDLAWVGAGRSSSSRQGPPAIAVPRASDFAGARAVARLSRTSQDTVSAGVGPLSASYSTGSSYGEVDYLDMNGDGFPDVVGKGRIQYTTAVGGLEAHNRAIGGLDHPLDANEQARNIGIGGNPAMFKANAGGEVDASGRGAPKGNKTGSQMALLGFSGSLGDGSSEVRNELNDLNGDGLPDRVIKRGDQLWVALNLGYGFAPEELWADAAINSGASQNFSLGVGLGFNGGIYDFAGGASLDESDSHNEATLADINGDGLPDLLTRSGQSLRVGLNTGNGFAAAVDWGGALPSGIDTSANVGLGGGAYFTIGIGPLCLPDPQCYIIINPGGDGAQSIARPETTIADVDGDGYPDHINSTADGSMTVARSRVGRTNLLRSVQRPLGASITLEYQRDGNTYDQPQSRWVLSRASVSDGVAGDGVDTQVRTYRYEHGLYNRLEREFYGYERVIEEERDASHGDALYRTIIDEYANDSYYTQGLLKRSIVQDSAGHPFDEVVNTYALVDLATGQAGDPQSTTASEFPQLIRADQRFYEGTATAGKQTYATYRYDALGNVTQIFDAGDSGAQDDTQTDITYASCPASYVMDAPARLALSSNGAELRRREGDVDCATGDVTQLREYLANGDAAVTDMAYFANGNLRQVSGPANQRGQRYQLTYAYDPDVQTHIARISDSFGYVSTATYNLKYGELANAVDINGNATSYAYDAFGRVTSVTGPFEQGGPTPTLRFEYHPEAAVPWAITRQIDSFRGPGATIDSVVFVDGLDRDLQTKQSATVFSGPDSAPQDVMVVSGRATFDFVGRLAATYYPLTEPLGTPGVFNPAYDTVQPTRVTFDILDRPTRATLPDNTSTTYAYGFGADRAGATQFETTVTDANGVVEKVYGDVRDLTTAIKELNQGGSQAIWTSYAYDPLDQLTQVTDDKNNVTRSAYDNFGRRTTLDSPDAGKTEWSYDLADNLVATVTANLRAAGKRIAYDYDFNRLARISYPDFPGNNVAYAYGEPGASDNRAGRISQVTDESGVEQRFYDKLGAVTREIKTVNSATGSPPKSYTTEYRYDTWGRLQGMTYPDGEVLTYQYDSGGMVRQVAGAKAGFSYPYINRLEYDKFFERAFVEAGNGVRTSYSYDPKNRLLVNLKAGKAGAAPFQNLAYTYDSVGNVLSQANNVAVPPSSQYGGPTSMTFRYDDLYRLTSASGSYRYAPNKQRTFSLSQSYDTIHNLVTKQQTDQIAQSSGKGLIQQPTTYSQTYAYGGAQPHAPTHIGDRAFGYDADGNQTGWTSDTNGTRRSIVWDEENRVQTIFENGEPLTYTYNDAGERVTKRGPQGETAYVNPFYTVRDGAIGTKHIFVDGTRLVSKLVNTDGTQEQFEYFYHADQLGSTNYVTDASGAIYEHLEYFPSGEAWIDESSNTQRTPYLFSGKELDEETGLYYYGARYYDPRTGVWQSGDPALLDFLGDDGAPDDSITDGVFDSANLNLYSYSYQNPSSFTDPDGRMPPKPGKGKGKGGKGKGKGAAKPVGLGKPKGAAKAKAKGKKTILVKDIIKGDKNPNPSWLAELPQGGKTPVLVKGQVKKVYKRPSYSVTKAQRAKVQGKTCVTCGKKAPKMIPDHKWPIAVEHYQSGSIDLDHMKSLAAVQPQCPDCSGGQGGRLSGFSKRMKRYHSF